MRVWDETGTASGWSEPARFEVELDRTSGWHASWIGPSRVRESVTPPSGAGPVDPVARALTPAPYLRRAFTVGQPVTSARLYVTALGLYEARLNGRRVGDGFLTPGWTDYTRRIAYQTYDVTGLLNQGDNVLGAIVAHGWYAGFYGFDPKRAGAHYGTAPELLAQLVLQLADGSEQRIVTDTQWESSTGAIRHADLLMGERHDLALEPSGWDMPGFTPHSGASGAGRDWRLVQVRERDATALVADPGPPIRVTEEIAPRSIATDDYGRHIVDFGQNLTGWLRINVDGPPGASVRIRHGEVLAADGSLYTDNLRTARATDEFTTAGGPEVLEPRFTLHGFRYAEITGYPGDIDQADITARVVHSDTLAAGNFESSLPWLDQLFRTIDWGQRGNFISVPTDCPQRDERLGWLGDAQVFARTACYNRDVAAFFAKWLDDVADAQLPSGAFTDVAPRLTLTGAGAPAWGDAGVIVPWTVWKMYGDTAVLDRHFGAMTRWMDFLERANPDYLRARELGNSYNDWLAPCEDDTPHELLATAYWAHDAALMAKIADATGRPDDAAGYRALWSKIRSAFADAFVAADGQVTSGTQTAYVLGLHMNLVPEDLRAAAADASWRRSGRGLAPDYRVRRRRVPAAGTEHHRSHRGGLPVARAGHDAVVAVHGRPWCHHDLGTLGRLDRRARLPVPLDELVQPLLARLGRRMALPVPPRHRPGARHRRLRPAAAPAAPWRVTGLGPRQLPVRPRHDQRRLETGPRPVHVLGGAAAQRHGHRLHPQPPRRRGPQHRGLPASVARQLPGCPRCPGGRLPGRLGGARVLRSRDRQSRLALKEANALSL